MNLFYLLFSIFNLGLVVQARFILNPFLPLETAQPDTYMDACEMIEFRDYECEVHQVITEDCYVLTMHRIVAPNTEKSNTRPVLLQHGLLGSSVDYLMNTAGGRSNDTDNHNLAFYLTKNGFDVWLMNVRGNVYSNKHMKINSDAPEFWSYTHDEHALLDLPAAIGYIQNYTDFSEVSYVGYSQGTLMAFKLLSTMKEANDILKPIVQLAPVTKVTHMKSPLHELAHFESILKYYFRRSAPLFRETGSEVPFELILCANITESLCANALFVIAGPDSEQLDKDRFQVYVSHLPAGTSRRNILHYMQSIKTDTFARYDYGNEGNLQCYGTHTPPLIDLSEITNEHIHLFVGDNDWLVDDKDLQFLRDNLKGKKWKQN